MRGSVKNPAAVPERKSGTNGCSPVRALGLFSGGLDSQLAVRVLQEQGIEVEGITFTTPFFGAGRGEAAARTLGIPQRTVDITHEHLEMVKAPRYGYGRHMNPCIDCHAMMFRICGDLMVEAGADFMFSGEVLGQRPMSQNRNSLRLIEKLSGYPGLIVRPLSARFLPETIPEKEGLVDRERLLDIQGRGRSRQLELAQRWRITDYPAPAGGCLLTDPGFSARFRELLEKDPSVSPLDVERLKIGRHFRLPAGSKVIVGRNHAENERLRGLGRDGDLFLKSRKGTGPLALLEGGADPGDEEVAAALVLRYGPGRKGTAPAEVGVEGGKEGSRVIIVFPGGAGDPERYRVG